MPPPSPNTHLTRHDHRTLLHFDYDCFYASVIESTNPALKTLPLAIQQKQIIVTCNYEARRQGLYKLQLVSEAKRMCPDVIIVLGEDLTRFRDASKALYGFLRAYSWNDRVERLGFDEVWMDVTDCVEYNLGLLNRNDLEHSFFQVEKGDPTKGFPFDASRFAGYVWPRDGLRRLGIRTSELTQRLLLGSHLAMHLRHKLEEYKGYTSTVGISTNRLLSKLVGNKHKPRGQTTLLPPYESDPATNLQNNVEAFMDGHDIGAVPWIGFKSAQKLRKAVLKRPPDFQTGLVYGGSKEAITVGMVRQIEGLAPEVLEKMLGGPGQPRGIGAKVWGLLHGVDDTDVAQAKNVPRQISIEDSYVRLDTMKQLMDELVSLSARLIVRMRVDLAEDSDDAEPKAVSKMSKSRAWIGKPQTLRLTTRPRLPIGPDGSRPRTFKRISRTGAMPSWVFNLEDSADALAERLVKEGLIPLFKKLHPEKSGWNLSLVNVAATDMVDIGPESKAAVGKNIQSMFQNQDAVRKDFEVTEESSGESEPGLPAADTTYSTAGPVDVASRKSPEKNLEATVSPTFDMEPSISLFKDDEEEDEDDETENNDICSKELWSDLPGSQEFECPTCGEIVPSFAATSHEQAHLDAG